MNTEELIKEAKRRYPIGTKVSNKNLGYNCDFEVTGDHYYMLGIDRFSSSFTLDCGLYTVYKDGKWADIISEPEKKPQKELTSLPENWYIKITEENRDFVKEEYCKIFPERTFYAWNFGSGFGVFENKSETSIIPEKLNWTEITLEQFKKWVVKKESNVVCGVELKHGEVYSLKSQYRWIVKFNEITKGNQFRHLGALTNEGKGVFHPLTDGFLTYTNYIKELKLATQEEKDHLEACIKAGKYVEPEKDKSISNKKFEAGKWYKFIWKWDNNRWYYGKLDRCTSDPIKWSIWFRTDGTNLQTNPSFNKQELGECYLLTDLSQIQQYLPDDHQDKISSQETKPLVGRYLKILVDNANCTDYKKGEYVQIVKDNTEGSVSCKRGWAFGRGSYNWKDSGIELMPEGFVPPVEEVNDYQVGDWVVITETSARNFGFLTNGNDSNKYQIGDVVQLTKKLATWAQNSQYHWWFTSKDVKDGVVSLLFRKALPHQIPSTSISKFTPENKVKVLRKVESNTEWWSLLWVSSMDKSIGQILTVLKDYGASVQLSDNFWYPRHVLQLIPEETPDGLWAKIEKQIRKFYAPLRPEECYSIPKPIKLEFKSKKKNFLDTPVKKVQSINK